MTETKITPQEISLGADSAITNTDQTTNSTSFVDLATVTSVTVNIGLSGLALVSIGARVNNSGANYSEVAVAVSGASTIAADASTGPIITWNGTLVLRAGATYLYEGLTPGSNTFTMKYVVSAGTGTFGNRKISVVPL